MDTINLNKKTEVTQLDSNFKKINIKDRLAEQKVTPILIIAAVLTVTSLGVFTKYQIDSKSRLKTMEQSYKLGQTLSEVESTLNKYSNMGKKDIENISKNQKTISTIINNLNSGSDGETQSLDKWDGFELKNIIQSWETVSKNIDFILKNKTSIENSTTIITTNNTTLEDANETIANLYSSTINSKQESDTKNGYELLAKTAELNDIFSKLNRTIPVNDKALDEVNSKINQIKNITTQLQNSTDTNTKDAANIFGKKIESLKELSNEDIKNLVNYNIGITNINSGITSINKALSSHEKLLAKIGGTDEQGGLVDDTSLLRLSQSLLALGLLFGVIIAVIFSRRQKQTQTLAKELERNQVNENALVELLESIKPLDEGDFTKEIKVDDKFLSQIANRIDNTRQQFKEIATLIKNNSNGILQSAASTEHSSNELMTISDTQVKKLEHTIESVNTITNSMDEIAQIAWIAQDEAKNSAERAAEGDILVTQSVNKMNEIRDTIQDSAKKIKKLGESAQSITEVTSLIKDITKQINILALNAAIQAASSGESGREFTIVAQEVQRLADDSEEATKKIEELISDIQTDTAVAIASMEKTTQEVVVGAKLTERAGSALQEINNLSNNTSEQIKGVSEQLEIRSQEMAEVTFEMRELQKVSDESKEAVSDTSIQVEALRDISDELKVTVERFKI